MSSPRSPWPQQHQEGRLVGRVENLREAVEDRGTVVTAFQYRLHLLGGGLGRLLVWAIGVGAVDVFALEQSLGEEAAQDGEYRLVRPRSEAPRPAAVHP
ncbi:hypothetical protein P3G67_20720 [Streptomyces sp. RB6PN23]|uniref:Uncharacterized protein n=1 Tax=Streptomyces silvisoli TaxID=3034235 RepID=A0ABT5ZRA9_9ACTN|nr:hypothetical protein [Streptomyces silvisoli]MDF3291608.1 hypothetical protein [Streptomyces silvisoli]